MTQKSENSYTSSNIDLQLRFNFYIANSKFSATDICLDNLNQML